MAKKMQFKKLADNRGMVYVPVVGCGNRKHPCRDCFSCQWCSSERCRICRRKDAECLIVDERRRIICRHGR